MNKNEFWKIKRGITIEEDNPKNPRILSSTAGTEVERFGARGHCKPSNTGGKPRTLKPSQATRPGNCKTVFSVSVISAKERN